MEKFYIEGDEFIPEINFDPKKDVLSIAGESYHEYTGEFFEPIFEWIDNYIKVPARKVQLKFRMDYFNTASSKCFYDIIDVLNIYAKDGGGSLEVFWYYEEEDLDMLESGEDYAEDPTVNIKLVTYKKGENPLTA
jgi:hypothetical protein